MANLPNKEREIMDNRAYDLIILMIDIQKRVEAGKLTANTAFMCRMDAVRENYEREMQLEQEKATEVALP